MVCIPCVILAVTPFTLAFFHFLLLPLFKSKGKAPDNNNKDVEKEKPEDAANEKNLEKEKAIENAPPAPAEVEETSPDTNDAANDADNADTAVDDTTHDKSE
ncbi:hypothetical protein BOX15_Mlig026914g1 [Macrostomum lignano]|uniref:Uncharacterized protein n=1 Tax=Macrostomum lignano TaxID=282301 RepID=A0A267EBX5_9PLAT|nr:hypothetical protein BOX15_Mlig026914g1 [Macrostomum lignano]